MMNLGDKRNNNLNIFIFISLVIHAVIFWMVPEWKDVLNFGVEGPAQGGVVRVIYSQPSPAKELSPITDPTSQTTAPQVEQPRPTQEPPKDHAASTPVVPESRDNITPPARPRPETVEVEPPAPPTVTEPLPKPEPEEVSTQLVTSETGEELHIEQQEEPESEPDPIQAPVEPEVEVEEPIDLEPDPESEREPNDELSGVSGTGTDIMGDITDGSGSVQESGMGEAESAPPPPPPPAGGSVLNIAGNGGVSYPKNAQDDKTEGIVRLQVLVGTDGRAQDVAVVETSGDMRLDRQAQLTFLNNWEFLGAEFDYVLIIDVSFSLSEGIRVIPVAINWAEL